MISKKLQKELVEQLNKEYYSAYIYLGMSVYASKQGFNGAANWFFSQYEEENEHGMKFFRYLQDQNADITLPNIKSVDVKFDSILDAFEKSLAHEQFMTKSLNSLSDLALKEKDHVTYNLLQWYVLEQVEEEATVSEIIDKIKLIGDNGFGLYSLDKELGERKTNDTAE